MPVAGFGVGLCGAQALGVALPLLAVNVIGMPYYLAPMGERVRHPWHAMLRPSGTVGLAAGIVSGFEGDRARLVTPAGHLLIDAKGTRWNADTASMSYSTRTNSIHSTCPTTASFTPLAAFRSSPAKPAATSPASTEMTRRSTKARSDGYCYRRRRPTEILKS